MTGPLVLAAAVVLILLWLNRLAWQAEKRFPILFQSLAYRINLWKSWRTGFGRDHGLRPWTSHTEFRRRVPVRASDDYSAYFEQIKAHAGNVLRRGAPRYWVKTSGTSKLTAARGTDRYLPLYRETLKQSSRSFQLAICLAYFDLEPHARREFLSRITRAKLIVLGSSQELERHHGLPCGYMSSIMLHEIPRFLLKRLIPGTRANSLQSWADKMALTLQLSAGEEVLIFAGMPPWVHAFFEFAHDRTNKPVSQLWPHAALVLHSGVPLARYKEKLDALWGDRRRLLRFKNAYVASEGSFALQEGPDSPIVTLFTRGIFYEFIPTQDVVDGTPKPDARVLALRHVAAAVDYAMVITTPGGLTRYLIGDTVRFTSVKPYRLEITGRLTHVLDLAGEKLSASQIEAACDRVEAALPVRIREYCVFPNDPVRGHLWVLELWQECATPEHLLTTARSLDQALQEHNSVYRVRRLANLGRGAILAPPEFCFVPPGTFARWQDQLARQGGQYKVPRLYTNHALARDLVRAGETNQANAIVRRVAL